MLSFLLDQNLSPQVAAQVRSKRPEIPIVSLYEWRGGEFLGASDERILEAACEGLTLVTYDRQTIPPLLKGCDITGRQHSGVIFVDNRTIASNDFGRLVRSLIAFWDSEGVAEWTDRVGYLPAPS